MRRPLGVFWIGGSGTGYNPCMRLRSAAAAIVLITVPACGVTLSQEDKLADIVYPFYDAWRWEKIPSLAMRVAPDDRSTFVEDYQSTVGDVCYADYEITEINVLEDHVTAEVAVTFHWYREADPTLVEAQVIETWQRDGKAKPWYRTDQEVVAGFMP